MAGLASTAAAIGLAAAAPGARAPAALATLEAGPLRYSLLAVLEGAGLGGLPADCLPPGEDAVLVAYRVANRGERPLTRAEASRPLALAAPSGQPLRRDERLSKAVEARSLPLLSIPPAGLAVGASATRADVFVTPAGAVGGRGWRVAPAGAAGGGAPLPPPRGLVVDGCPRRTPPPGRPRAEDDEDQAPPAGRPAPGAGRPAAARRPASSTPPPDGNDLGGTAADGVTPPLAPPVDGAAPSGATPPRLRPRA